MRGNDWLLRAMRRLNVLIYRVLQVAITVLIGVMLIPVTLQIFSRFFEFIPRYIWTEEVARFCLMWLIMLGATIAVRDGTHFDVDVLPTPMTNHGKAVARLIVHVPILLVALIFITFGWRFALFGYEQSSEMTGINMLSIHIAWPFAGICWLLFLVEKIIDDVKLYRGARRGSR
jgi:TRAP-type C4-dicarboxylate transport system permease small subunit